MVSQAKKVVPGDRICSFEAGESMLGSGVHLHDGSVYSSLLGFLHCEEREGKKFLSVRTEESSTITTLPKSSDVVTCKVSSVNPREVKVQILSVEGKRLPLHFRGVVKKEDIRAKEKDSVVVYKCFRPGDLVLARVISIGDTSSYFLSTAENELGVVFAKSSASGIGMIPVSWCEMLCPESKTKEFRKVARVIAR